MAAVYNYMRSLCGPKPVQPNPAKKFFKKAPDEMVGNILSYLKDDEIANLGVALTYRDAPRGPIKRHLNQEQLIQAKTLSVGGLDYKGFQDLMRDFGANFTSENKIKIDLHRTAPTDVELELISTAYTADGIVSRFPNMRSLDLSRCTTFTDAGLACLAREPHLVELDLSRCTQITREGLAHLEHLSELETLDLSHNPNVADEDLANIVQWCPNLKKLNLANCANISNDGMAEIAKLARLEELNVSNTPVSDAGLAHLANKNTLRSLSAALCNITDVGIDSIATLRELRKLDLRGNDAITTIDPVTQNLRGLTALNVEHCTGIVSFDSLGRLSSLQSLRAAGCPNIRPSLSRVTPFLGQLHTLDLSRCELIDRNCDSLSNLKALKTLTLSGNGWEVTEATGFYDYGWRKVQKGITTALFGTLSRLPHLTDFTADDCQNMSYTARNQAFEKCKSLQNLRINNCISSRKIEVKDRKEQALRQAKAAPTVWQQIGSYKAEIGALATALVAAAGWYVSQGN